MRIYFARHGESQANLLHEISNRGLRHGLTRTGREQAHALAQRLQDLSICRIYSSPLLRAIETSLIVANQLGLEYEVVDALREYDCGILEGRSDDAAWERWQELFDAWTIHEDWDRRLEGGESFSDLRGRFEPFIQGLVDQYGDSDEGILCVSHGGFYRMMLPLVLANVNDAKMAEHSLDYTSYIVSELGAEGLVCLEWNEDRIEQKLTVRPYRPSDLDEVVAMWRASKRAAFPYVEVQQLYTLENDTGYFRDVIAPECEVWLAVSGSASGSEDEPEGGLEGGGKILGLIALRQILIDQLFVGLENQRQGVGAALLAKARERSPDQLRAYTFQKNSHARAFFEKHGFEIIRAGLSPPPENEPDLEYFWSAGSDQSGG
jgi:broad specificity phosphatase PhoE/ribosomal protein S18 acetylase RimI-like enzyme